MKLSKCYPKCPKTFKDCIPSKAAIQAEIVINKIQAKFYHCEFCNSYHFTSREIGTVDSLFKMFRRMVVEGEVTHIQDLSMLEILYKATTDKWVYTFIYNPADEFIKIQSKQPK
jgi:hypothetical protein